MDPMSSMSDMFSLYLEQQGEAESCFKEGDDDDEEAARSVFGDDGKAFWEAQHKILQEAMSRTSSIERRIQRDTEDALKRMESLSRVCRCSNRPMKECGRNCILRDITDHLRDAGYNSALCTSKWKRSSDIPSGEHSYVDVVIDSKDGKRTPVRVLIELNFRAEFEMARASKEHISLVSCLPKVFVGKSEKLRNVIKIMCAAAKRCMKDNKMHMAPWRKHKYMQSKWLGTCERTPATSALPVATRVSNRQSKQRASMLTFDLQCTVVEVV